MNTKVTPERLKENLSVGEYLDLRNGDIGDTIVIMSKFVLDENGEYLSPEDGLKKIRAVKFVDLGEIAEDFAKKIREGLVSPPSGAAIANPE